MAAFTTTTSGNTKGTKLKINPTGTATGSGFPSTTPAVMPSQTTKTSTQTSVSNNTFGATGVKAANPLVDNYKAPTTTISSAYQSPTQTNTTLTPPKTTTQTSTPATTTTPGILDRLLSATEANAAAGRKASEIAADYGQRIADVGALGARHIAGLRSTGTSPVAAGNAAIAAQTTAAQQQALAEGGQMALQGTGQELTAAGQRQTGILGALTQAGITTQAPYGTPLYQPATGQFVTPSDTGNLLGGWASYLAQGGDPNQVPASVTGNIQLWQQVLNQARQQNPQFDVNTALGQAAGRQALGGAGGTAATGVVQDLTGQVANLQGAANGAEANFNLMLNLAKQGGVNATNVPILNTLQQNVSRGLTSNDAVVNFKSLLQTVRSQYASIIGGGTITVEALQEAQNLIPDNVSISALSALEGNLRIDAQNRIAGLQTQINQYSGGGTPSSGGGIVTDFNW